MANPQVENGHMRIANDFWEAWCKIGSSEDRTFKAIVRLTWGWGKKQAPITQKQLMDLTGLNRRSVTRATAELTRKSQVTKISVWGRVSEYSINKDFEQWTCDETVPSDNIDTWDKTVPGTRDNIVPTPCVKSVPTPSLHENHVKTRENQESSRSRIIARYENLKPGRMTRVDIDRLNTWLEDYGEEKLLDAISIAIETRPNNPDSYIGGVLRNRKAEAKPKSAQQPIDPNIRRNRRDYKLAYGECWVRVNRLWYPVSKELSDKCYNMIDDDIKQKWVAGYEAFEE